MSKISRYSPELRERAVRMVKENRADYRSEWAAFTAISKLFGMSPETLRTWVRRAQVDAGSRPGITSDERARLKQLECEVTQQVGVFEVLGMRNRGLFLGCE
jgi:transposase